MRHSKLIFLVTVLLTVSINLCAQTDTTLKVRFSFDNEIVSDSIITDVSGNNVVGTLKREATISTGSGDVGGLLSLGDNYGYLDLGPEFGTNLISKLQDYTLSTYIYISDNAENGVNLLFEFGNYDIMHTSDPSAMYFSTYYSAYFIGTPGLDAGFSNWGETERGIWKHIAISYSSETTTAKLYFDGIEVASSNSISKAPKDLGETIHNTIGGSSFPSDVCLTKTFIDEFRIYNVALPDSTIEKLASSLPQYNFQLIHILLLEALDKIQLTDGQQVESDLSLPTIIDGINIFWSSSDSSTISPDGTVVRPEAGSPEKNVLLTATAVNGDSTASKQFNLIVLPYLTDAEAVKEDADSLTLDSKILHSDINLPASGLNGSTVTWQSDTPDLLSDNGELIYYPAAGTGPVKVVLTATLTYGTETLASTFNVYIAEEDPYTAYLFVHFKEGYESIRFAISDDGYNYKALNNDDPVLNSQEISSTGGVRDPHILRGNDGISYYMVATDMRAALGWDSNRAIVLMKSTNLIDWQSSVINIQNTYPTEFSDIQNAWAPQTIYDETVGKYMIYWAMRKGVTGNQKIYYAYANDSFTALETVPTLLFERPDNESVIDADIIEKDSLFYMFYKTESGSNGIKKAVSSSLTGPYDEIDKFLDQNDYCVEGSCIFRLINSDTYIMMYDAYCTNTYQFTRTTDLTNFTVVDDLVAMDFAPKHGTVMPITSEEKAALIAKWDPSNSLPLVKSPKGKVISTDIYQMNGMYIGHDASRLNNGIYIRKQKYENGVVVVDKLFINQ